MVKLLGNYQRILQRLYHHLEGEGSPNLPVRDPPQIIQVAEETRNMVMQPLGSVEIIG